MKKCISFILTFILVFSLSINSILATEIETPTSIWDEGEKAFWILYSSNDTFRNEGNKMFKKILTEGAGFVADFTSQDMESASNRYFDLMSDMDVFRSDDNDTYINPKYYDSETGSIILPAEYIDKIKQIIDEQTKATSFVISPLTTGADTTKLSTYGIDTTSTTYFSDSLSGMAFINFVREKGGLFNFEWNGRDSYLFSIIDHNVFKYSYLVPNSSGYNVAFVDGDLNPAKAYISKTMYNVFPWKYSSFSIDDLNSYILSHSYVGWDYSQEYCNYAGISALTDSRACLQYIGNESSGYHWLNPYYGKPFRCFTSMQALYDYIYGDATFYFTSQFYEESKDISIKLDTLNKMNDDFYNNIYTTLTTKLKDGVDADQLQEIIDSTVSDELEKINESLDNIDDNLDDVNSNLKKTNEKLDKIISELNSILVTLGLFFIVDDNGNITVNNNADINVELKAEDLKPIIDKLEELNNDLKSEFSEQNEEIKKVSSSIESLQESLQTMINNQEINNEILINGFDAVLKQLDSLELNVDLEETNTLLKGILKGINQLVDISYQDLMNDLYGTDKKSPEDIINENNWFEHIEELLQCKFPFSMPWDLALAFHVFAAEPVCPNFDIPLRLNIYDLEQVYYIHVDGSDFEYISYMSRFSFTIIFYMYLYKFTLKFVLKK